MLLCYVLRKQLQNNIANWPKIYFPAPFQESNVGCFRDAQAPLSHIRHVFVTNLRKFVIGALGGYSVARNSVYFPLKASQVTQKLAVENTEYGDANTFTFSLTQNITMC